MKRIAWFATVVLATLTVTVLLWQFRAVAVLFLFSLAIAAALRPPVNYLIERGVPRGVALALTYFVVLLVIGGLVFMASGRIVSELAEVSGDLVQTYQRFKAQAGGENVLGIIAERLPPIEAIYQAIGGTEATTLATTTFGVTVSVFDNIGKIAMVLVLSIYWSSDQVRFERLWLSLLPAEQRSPARNIWRAIEKGVGAYLRSEVIQGLLAGLMLAFGYSLLGLPAPVLLGVVGALAWFIPLIGGAVAFVLAIAGGAVHGLVPAISAGILTVAVFLILELVVERRIFDRRRYSSVLTVLVMVALADAMGIFGLLVAAPTAAAIQIFYRELVSQPTTAVPTRQRSQPQLAQLQDRLGKARDLLDSSPEPAPELTNLVGRLEALLDDAGVEVQDDNQQPPPANGLARLVAVQEAIVSKT